MVRALVAAAVCMACQGQPTGPPPGSGSAPGGSGAASGARGSAVGSASDHRGSGSDADDGRGSTVVGAIDARGSGSSAAESDGRGKPDEPESPDPSRVIAELGAIPAWQAVVDRAQLLGRRGQHGVVYGRVGPTVMVPAPAPVGPVSPAPASGAAGSGSAVRAPAPGSGSGAGPTGAAGSGSAVRAPAAGSGSGSGVGPAGAAIDAGGVPSPYVWLIDDTEGNGTLGIRILLADKAKEGDRIAAGGAWQLDGERRWYWKPDAIQPLPPAAPSDLKESQPPAPSHAIATGALPPGARTASVARDNDAIYFQIVGPAPATDGDGWQIADQLGSPAVLLLSLPGERPSYGGQDMRAADERWQLRRGQTYWVRIGRLHKRGDKPPGVNARTAPIRVL